MSQHIQFFSQNNTHKEIVDNRLDLARPQKLNFAQGNTRSEKWVECKILGKNISIRSYAAACKYNSELYVYGGFQILNGILSDFHKINLDVNQSKFEWTQIQAKNKKSSPGPRARHALINYKNKIYLIGGIKSTYEISNDIYQFNIEQNTWLRLQTKGIELPNLQSFGNTLVNDRIILMCGYNGKKCQYTNDVYQYNITTNTINALYLSNNIKKNQPLKRSGCAITSDGKNIFMFGGKEQQNRFNDLWLFSLETKQYSRIQDKCQLRPFVRNGHTMNYYQDRLYIFGGIHEVTWQLNDLHIFHIKRNQWTTLELDSARRKQQKLVSLAHEHVQGLQKHLDSNHKHPHHTGILHKQISPISKKDPVSHFKEQSSQGGFHHPPNSPGKMIDEQRKKAFYLKKSEMLKEFQVQEKQKSRYINIQPTSQAMQNSLDFIGNPTKKTFGYDKLTQFGKTSCSKFLQPLSNNSNIVPGKKPCARDGHNSVLMNNELIIFGGDRHQMSFNDLFKLNMSVVKTILQNAQ